MPIAIVSALPKAAPLAPANASSIAEGNIGPAPDFISLLLGQLTAAIQSDAGSNPGATPQFTGTSGRGKPADDEDAEVGDPLDVLAVLAPFEPENRPAPVDGDTSSVSLAEMVARASPVDQQSAVVDQGKSAANPLPAPASETAAKFAALVDGMADEMVGEDAPHAREPAQLSPVASAVATSVQSSREAAPPSIPLPTPLHSRNWSNDFAQTVTWIATRNCQSADLTLNPPALGNIEISLKFDNDRSTATAVFVSANADVRETIETALPRLREMLAGAGIELGQTNVSAESFRQTAGNGQNAKDRASPSGDELAILEPDLQTARTAASPAGAGHGLVDMFI